jgi:hypothetical protein
VLLHGLAPAHLVVPEALGALDVTVVVVLVRGAGALALYKQFVEVVANGLLQRGGLFMARSLAAT